MQELARNELHDGRRKMTTTSASPAVDAPRDGASEDHDMPMRSMLRSDLDTFSELTELLFSRLETPSRGTGSSAVQATALELTGTLRSLQDVDERIRRHLKLARKHASNQARIEWLKEGMRIRDERVKTNLRELNSIKKQLDSIEQVTGKEVKNMHKAERSGCSCGPDWEGRATEPSHCTFSDPISFDDLLSYASRLSSITSAPPGFKLPTNVRLPTPPPTQEAEDGGKEGATDGEDEEKGKRAAPTAYYDPKMPGMPEQLPFPDEGMMRRGALGALAMGQGITFAPVPAPGTDAALEGAAEDGVRPEEEISEEMREEMRIRAEETRRAQEAEEAEAFDLDLN